MLKNFDLISFKDSITARLLSIATQFSDRPALSVDGATYSYGRLFQIALGVAEKIRHHPDSRCLILSGRNAQAYVALLGALLAGKTYVFLNQKDAFPRLQSTFLKIDSNLLLVDSDHRELGEKLIPSASIYEIHLNQKSTHFQMRPNFVSLYAYLMLTSGSTGEPKAIAITHQNLLAYVKNISERAHPNCFDRVSQISELTFDFSIHDIFLAWCSGACLCVLPDRKMLGFLNFLMDQEITFLAAVPSTIRLLNQLNRQNHEFPKIRYTAFCGEILTDEVARRWHHYAPNTVIDNLYGPTEATVAISGFRWTSDYTQNYVSIGEAFPDQEILLLNEEGALAGPGEIGEIYLLGSQVASEYWCDEKLSKDKFFLIYSIKHQKNIFAYRTGDLAQYDATHLLHYRGRCDDQMKLRGYRVEKIEIESAIQRIAQTELAAVVSQKCESTGNINYLTCFIGGSPFKSEEIARRCRNELPDYMIPNSIISLPEFPYNKNGKIDYQKLKKFSEAQK